MVVNGSKIVPKSSKKFVCTCCDYSTSRKSQYSRHLLTAKHLNRVNDSKMIVKKFQEVPNKKVSHVVVEKNTDMVVDFTYIIFSKCVSLYDVSYTEMKKCIWKY